MKLGILTYESNCYFAGGSPQGFHHGFPVSQVGLGTIQLQAVTCYLCQMFFFHGKRSLIEMFDVEVLQYAVAGHVTEQGNFIFQCLVKGMFAAAYDDIWLQSHTL